MTFSINNYSELRKIPDGGMNELFHALEIRTRRNVMIKKAALDPAHPTYSLRQFQTEIYNVSSLKHENIIRIIDYGFDDDHFYIVMEYIDGSDLNTLISTSTFNRELCLLIVLKALYALNFLHEKGLVHGNIKPSNLLIDKNGRVVLSDLGISQVKAYGFNSQNNHGDSTSALFIAPEQINLVARQAGLDGDLCKGNGITSFIYNELSLELPCALNKEGMEYDLWSIGVILYRICSGSYPFQNKDLAGQLSLIKHSAPPEILGLVPDLPQPISEMIGKCLQKVPNHRPHSIYPVINALQKSLSSKVINEIDSIIAAQIQGEKVLYPIPEKTIPIPDNILSADLKSQVEQDWKFEYNKVKKNQPVSLQSVKSSGFKSLLSGISHFFNPHMRFSRPVIALITLAVLVVAGILLLLFIKPAAKLDQIVSSTSTTFEKMYDPPVKPEIQTLNPAILPVQDSESIETMPADTTEENDSSTKSNLQKAKAGHILRTPMKKSLRTLTNADQVNNEGNGNPADLTGVLYITVNPPDAQVFINEALTTQKKGIRLSGGNYTISAKAAGYQTYEKTISIEPGKTLQISLELKSSVLGNGQLHIYSYPWANLYIDDELTGTTPTPSPVSLVEGNHKVVLLRDGYQKYNETVIIKNGEVTRLQVQLKKTDEQ